MEMWRCSNIREADGHGGRHAERVDKANKSYIHSQSGSEEGGLGLNGVIETPTPSMYISFLSDFVQYQFWSGDIENSGQQLV
jgi:hypothetical protein